eukprot:gnl/TRDRNA2_/TRDRNA2_33884_c0_seq1.p1 gnl/TRDRNA2_/TRDRNA2_33884_c0~~gnl/TRDRNA2_/TRDRNA2_33884_c0_seq1.p1  ORF type:complete len:305 (-),score=36.88 gnl/TRDRNA2_/TRDRNA2_33884_c0_seq1:89-1003(-)
MKVDTRNLEYAHLRYAYPEAYKTLVRAIDHGKDSIAVPAAGSKPKTPSERGTDTAAGVKLVPGHAARLSAKDVLEMSSDQLCEHTVKRTMARLRQTSKRRMPRAAARSSSDPTLLRPRDQGRHAGHGDRAADSGSAGAPSHCGRRAQARAAAKSGTSKARSTSLEAEAVDYLGSGRKVRDYPGQYPSYDSGPSGQEWHSSRDVSRQRPSSGLQRALLVSKQGHGCRNTGGRLYDGKRSGDQWSKVGQFPKRLGYIPATPTPPKDPAVLKWIAANKEEVHVLKLKGSQPRNDDGCHYLDNVWEKI